MSLYLSKEYIAFRQRELVLKCSSKTAFIKDDEKRRISWIQCINDEDEKLVIDALNNCAKNIRNYRLVDACFFTYSGHKLPDNAKYGQYIIAEQYGK